MTPGFRVARDRSRPGGADASLLRDQLSASKHAREKRVEYRDPLALFIGWRLVAYPRSSPQGNQGRPLEISQPADPAVTEGSHPDHTARHKTKGPAEWPG